MNDLGYTWREILLKLVEKNHLLESRIELLEEENTKLKSLQQQDLTKWVSKELKNSSQH